jgi:hypothetical protein
MFLTWCVVTGKSNRSHLWGNLGTKSGLHRTACDRTSEKAYGHGGWFIGRWSCIDGQLLRWLLVLSGLPAVAVGFRINRWMMMFATTHSRHSAHKNKAFVLLWLAALIRNLLVLVVSLHLAYPCRYVQRARYLLSTLYR